MGNQNHDPKSGEFSSGPSGGAGDHHRDASAADHARLGPSGGQTSSDARMADAKSKFETHKAALDAAIAGMEKLPRLPPLKAGGGRLSTAADIAGDAASRTVFLSWLGGLI